MDKELEKSSEPSDIFASKQIKNIINTHREVVSAPYRAERSTGSKNSSLEAQQESPRVD